MSLLFSNRFHNSPNASNKIRVYYSNTLLCTSTSCFPATLTCGYERSNELSHSGFRQWFIHRFFINYYYYSIHLAIYFLVRFATFHYIMISNKILYHRRFLYYFYSFNWPTNTRVKRYNNDEVKDIGRFVRTSARRSNFEIGRAKTSEMCFIVSFFSFLRIKRTVNVHLRERYVVMRRTQTGNRAGWSIQK